MLDADVLFLRRPDELIGCMESLGGGTFVFQKDIQNAYFAEPAEIDQRFGVKVPEQANVGIMFADVHQFDYARVEAWLHQADLMRHSWAEQTLWTMYAGNERAKLLGDGYSVTLEKGVGRDRVVKHYISPIREFIYTEGLPEVRNRLRTCGLDL
jgi:hypothetical protein